MTPAATTPRSVIPYVIIGAFVLFGAFIGTMVKRAMGTTIELVSPDYYQQELAYQQRIKAVANAAALPAPVQLTPDAGAQTLTIDLPEALRGQAVQGTVRFFRPADSRLDLTVPLQPDAAGEQVLNTAHLARGHWRVRLDFTAAGQTYYVEQALTLTAGSR